MLFSAEEHAKRPPSSWEVRKAGRRWQLCSNSSVLDTFDTKKEAEQAKISGMYANLYEKERRWYAGEQVGGWKPYVRLAVSHA